ncbi:NADPH-dependent FMN reductase [Paenibacillus dauci]|uniref:NADPH-dependent FMN reductase n=1 Tax=Paenibacillus dauci TaxID=1567106 RepID=UPI000619131C|nr:NADPH-dependent FMN reductase [Paenibacillus dauci]
MHNQSIKVVCISGSLREQSSNSRLLSSIMSLMPSGTECIEYHGLSELPHFNPDLDQDHIAPHAAIQQWRDLLGSADAVLICTPEYAGGIPGSLKNALDWIVSSGELVNKPTAAISASPHPQGGSVALESLKGTLLMMNALITDKTTLSIPFISKKFGAEGRLSDADTLSALNELIIALLPGTKS